MPSNQRAIPPTFNEIPPSPTSTTALTQANSEPDTPRLQPRQQKVPSISVTKPPAPLPVELPTALDLTPPDSPSNSYDEDDEDLERGMREAKTLPGLVSRPSQQQEGKRHPLEPEDDQLGPAPAPPSKKAEEIPDLLTGVDKDQPLVDMSEEISLHEPAEADTTVRLVGEGGSAGDAVEGEQGVSELGEKTTVSTS